MDRPGLLSWIAGSLSLAGLSILTAQAFTTDDGAAVDVFEVEGAYETKIHEERWRAFRSVLRKVLEGRISLEHRVEEQRRHYPSPRRPSPVTVKVDQGASDFFTVIEVGAPDRIGLLYDITRTLAYLRLDVHLAKVATYTDRVIDAFYVRDELGRKVQRRRRSPRSEGATFHARLGTQEVRRSPAASVQAVRELHLPAPRTPVMSMPPGLQVRRPRRRGGAPSGRGRRRRASRPPGGFRIALAHQERSEPGHPSLEVDTAGQDRAVARANLDGERRRAPRAPGRGRRPPRGPPSLVRRRRRSPPPSGTTSTHVSSAIAGLLSPHHHPSESRSGTHPCSRPGSPPAR